MKFSIVTVCWNSAAVLPRARDSLSSQTCRDYEWVVVDGASTDGTMEIVRDFDAAPVASVSEPDKGIYDAMNKGVRMARGEYVFFLNSDDALHDPNVLADVARILETQPAADLLYGNVVYAYPSRKVLRTFAHINRLTLPFESLCHQAVFARRVLFDSVGTFDTRFRLSADYDWLIRVFRSGARTRWIDRRVAQFTAGGVHAQDARKLADENRQVRLQYLSPLAMRLGNLARRLRHRYHRHFRAHPLGQLPIES
ncbi:MAG: glycosyltransferase [Immundisolibacter sp.]|uniref:glycosyltransferase family 2 protein n=1 Tax=Immundisolibacter sp. TaxID=1934948 RepID=UPI00198AD4D9|nr:glycosyltransferase family 2 protein [Immundisolibacter sp.]MBC7162759.1 glycosyltransferase [Immundisolibacter sp.]